MSKARVASGHFSFLRPAFFLIYIRLSIAFDIRFRVFDFGLRITSYDLRLDDWTISVTPFTIGRFTSHGLRFTIYENPYSRLSGRVLLIYSIIFPLFLMIACLLYLLAASFFQVTIWIWIWMFVLERVRYLSAGYLKIRIEN